MLAETAIADAERAVREQQLLRRYHEDGDLDARARLAEEMMPLARALAGRYQGRGEQMEDLMQVACLGILKAIDGFDLSRAVRFSSYATPTVLGEIKRYFRDRTWMVRPPRALQELHMLVAKARDRLTTKLGRPPTVQEIADTLDVAVEEVLEAIETTTARHARSFAEPTGEDVTLADQLGGGDPELPRAELRAIIDAASEVLSERDRKILRLRFDDDLTQIEIARIVGVSQMQVSRLIRQSLARLRMAIGEQAQEVLAEAERVA